MGYLPEVKVTCHICGSTFTLHNRLEKRGRHVSVSSEPAECPACGAPVKSIPRLDVGLAKSLLLTEAGAPHEKKVHGTAEQFLQRYSRTEQDVDTLLALARNMDYTAWEKLHLRLLQHDKDTGLQAELRFIPKLREQAQSGQLLERLQQAAEQVKQELRAERARHIAIFKQRK